MTEDPFDAGTGVTDPSVDDLPDPLRRAIAAAVPDRTVRGVERPGGSDHPGNEVLRVTFADDDGPPRAFLKVAVDGDGGRIARAAGLSRYAGANAPVRTPEVLAADPDADPPYLATAPLAGRPLVDGIGGDRHGDPEVDSLVAVLRRVGAATAALHAPRFDRAGAVRGGDADVLDLDAGPWAETLRRVRLDPMTVPDRFEGLPGRAAELLDATSGRIELGDGGAAVVHDDLHSGNVFAAGTEGGDDSPGEGENGDLPGDGGDEDSPGNGRGDDPPGILDFEAGMVGDPALDLVRTEELAVDGRPELSEGERERVRAALFAGYREAARVHGVPVGPDGRPPGFAERRRVYRVVTFLRTAVTFEAWAPDAPEPVDELAEWVRGEFDDRVRAARE